MESSMRDKEIKYMGGSAGLTIRTESDGEYMFEGYAATWDVVDTYNTQFKKGAFKKTIAERSDRIKVLWNHNEDELIGKIIEIREDAKGLFVKGKLTKGVTKADDVYRNLMAGVIDTLSFGFKIIQSKRATDKITQITEVKLYEVSPVSFEANKTAKITDVRKGGEGMVSEEEKVPTEGIEGIEAIEKQERAEKLKETLKDDEVHARGYKIMEALYSTLGDIWWSEDQAKIVSKIDSALADFHSVYLKWASDFVKRFWEIRKLAMSKNELSAAYIKEVNETSDEISSRTAFTKNELKLLLSGKILPSESRHKLAELPEAIGMAHQKQRSKVVETLCSEIRKAGFTEAEKIRFTSLLGLRSEEEPKIDSQEHVFSMLSEIRSKLN